MHLVMICGQGSSGKSTFCKYLQSIDPNIIHISIDNIALQDPYDENIHFPIYISQIQHYVDKNHEQDIVLIDFAHDSPLFRKSVLEKINFNNSNIIFYTISLRPGENTICKWQEKRIKKELTEEDKALIKNLYENFKYPTVEEFKGYPFKNVINISIDNSKFNIN